MMMFRSFLFAETNVIFFNPFVCPSCAPRDG